MPGDISDCERCFKCDTENPCPPKQTLKANPRTILTKCIENGITVGYKRAHKHTDHPESWHIHQEIERAIWLEIDEFFSFEDEVAE